jgi:outer membrane protein OmpA-like peptidoglycan-associated protein
MSHFARVALITCCLQGPVFAQTTTEEIIHALAPQKTRSLSISEQPAKTAKEQNFIESIRSKPEHALSASERDELSSILADKATAVIPIQFDYKSYALKDNESHLANELGQALTSPALKGKTFVIAGHTDAKGSDKANLLLSERRARAVKTYLTRNFSIDPGTLIIVGYGKTRLKNQDQPFAAENRRVEAINIQATAAR